MASESESSAESEGGREVEAPIACGSGCFLPLLEEDTWLQVRRPGQKSSFFFSWEALEKNKIFMGQLCLVDGGGWWWCVFVYIIYLMVLDACGSRGRCGSVSHMTAPSELPNRTSVGG